MTALDWVLVGAIVVLGALVVAGLVLGARALRQLQTHRADAQEREDQAVGAAEAKVADANAKAASVRAEAAAAKAEASAARAEARRVLEAAHSEADTILEHAHRQAESDAEQVRAAAPPPAGPGRPPGGPAPPPAAPASARSPCSTPPRRSRPLRSSAGPPGSTSGSACTATRWSVWSNGSAGWPPRTPISPAGRTL